MKKQMPPEGRYLSKILFAILAKAPRNQLSSKIIPKVSNWKEFAKTESMRKGPKDMLSVKQIRLWMHSNQGQSGDTPEDNITRLPESPGMPSKDGAQIALLSKVQPRNNLVGD